MLPLLLTFQLLSTTSWAVPKSGPFKVGGPITVDGHFGKAEWKDAHQRLLPSGIILATKRHGEDILIGIILPPGQLRYIDLYIANQAGEIHNLHASMKQGERRLPNSADWTDRTPAFTWGPFTTWRTNIVERKQAPLEAPIERQLKPYEGFEFLIPVRHIGSGPWKLRVEIRDFTGAASDINWPKGSTRYAPAGWFLLSR